MEYNFKEIEQKWQKAWRESGLYVVDVDSTKPKYYVLDMFPYPSGAGLHVGHPLGYIASDIYARYKRQRGFNVLHPMGYDAFGLPAEQYAIQTGQHPAVTTEQNITRYREQLSLLGFSFDPTREVRTCDPSYYRWTQWAFGMMYNHYYDADLDKAMPIQTLIERFEAEDSIWGELSDAERENILQTYRLAYQADTVVNWCEALGTVLANDEVKDGLSERGGHPVEQKLMRQWLLRVTAYAPRLVAGLEGLEWSESLKEIQRNWIGRSCGATLFFEVAGPANSDSNAHPLIEVFTTRADTVFGVTFMVLAPEHALVDVLCSAAQREQVVAYQQATKKRSERERIADTRRVSGVFTGGYAVHPFTGAKIPVYISDYVLAGYGTGAIMAVPAHDSRDWAFARHFDLPVVAVVDCSAGVTCDLSQGSYDAKDGVMINSDFLDGLAVAEAIEVMWGEIERRSVGCKKVNYRLRDAIFSRQRYWGEPFPIYYKDGLPQLMDLDELPLELPAVANFTPTAAGEPPLARVEGWCTADGDPYETSTMPGFAGSSAYYLRYMDPHNDGALVGEVANQYWQDVDLYVGGIEHATGHLIYSRFWNKFLFDIGKVCRDEPFRKLVNQGMIQGRSSFVYRIKDGKNRFVSYELREQHDTQAIHVDVNMVNNDILDIEAFRAWRAEFADAEFIVGESGRYMCGWAVEKMSKSMYNVVNPDTIVERYGADTLRMYEMFLGPLEQSKPWDTNGIDGVHKFLRRVFRMVTNAVELSVSANNASSPATAAEMKVLHKTIKKVSEDIESFSFNTAVSAFMICLNELQELECRSIAVWREFVVLLTPFAPHVCEELWGMLSAVETDAQERSGGGRSVCVATWPMFDAKYLVESSFEYPVSFNGKMRFKQEFALDISVAEIEAAVRADERTAKYADGAPIKKMIVVPGKIINIVI